jgi:LacI family transcriptional regulator
MVERTEDVLERFSYISIDNYNAARLVTAFFLAQGKQRIATITGDLKNADGIDRLAGYSDQLVQSPIGFNEALVYAGAFSWKAGYEGMRYLLPQGVDALFAANDRIAMGAMQYLREQGLRVPQDVAVIGFDDLPAAAEMGLSSVRQPVAERGSGSAALLIDQIEGLSTDRKIVMLPTELIIRDSSGGSQTLAEEVTQTLFA